MAKNDYTKESIQSLTPREHVRKRPSMYCGDTSTPNQLMMELFSNALDEHNIGHGDTISVSIDKSGLCRIEDFAQGFLVDEMRDDGKTVFQAAFDTMNTSGKYTDDGVYEGSSLGLNGIGTKLVTYLSKNVMAETVRDGRWECNSFSDGVLYSHQSGDAKKTAHTGTTVTYLPDEQFFGTDKTSVSFFKKFFNDITCICPTLTIFLNGEKIGHNSIEDMLDEKRGKDIEIIGNHFVMNTDQINLAMTFTSSSQAKIIPYVNYGITSSGPHITGIKSTLTRVFNNWAKENNLLTTKDKNLDGAAIQEGIVLVCNINSKGVKYNAQVKDDIIDMDTSFTSALGQQLEVWLDNNPEDAKAILDKAILTRKAAEAAKRARAAVKNKKKSSGYIKMPTTLSDCWSKNRSECELIICEGKSAQSGLVAARDSKTQAIYGVRGMMISARKTTVQKFLKNQEVNNLLIALGLDIDSATGKIKYDVNKLRYGKIIACADADAPGAAIENLLFNILWYICPELIQNGHVYSAVPPLFRVTTKNNEYVYLRDATALEEYKKKHGNKIKSIGREKGLGEMDSKELGDTLLNVSTRNIVQLYVSDIDKTEQMFEDLYGKAVQPRVDYILNHSENGEVNYE